MADHYLINEDIEFDSIKNTLISRSHPQEKITLHTPAARCLLLLLENKHSIIDKECFFKHVWNKHGAHVTANTLYQNISILRRGFIKMGLGNEIINTIPRKGLQLSQHISIEIIQSQYIEYPTDLPNAPTDKTLQIPQTTVSHSERKKNPTSYKSNKIKTVLITTSLLLLSLLCALIVNKANKKEAYFSNYQYIKNIGNCAVYTNLNTAIANGFDEYVYKSSNLCNEYQYTYLTRYRFSPRLSVIHCYKPIETEQKKRCISEYYILEHS